jgi:hypothetical protein
MVMTNGTDGNSRKVGSLGELSRNVAPPRDLWPAIAAQITAGTVSPDSTAGERRRLRPTGMQWAAFAAVVAALAVGIWLGRSVLPPTGEDALDRPVARSESAPLGRPATEGLPNGPSATLDPNSVPASFVTDPRYTMQRAELIRGLEEQLKTLPPDTQQKVAGSLTTIRTSIQELQDAIGKDPANALLQELLVNSYQDEMRVLTAVHEAGGVSGGI